LAAKPVAEVFAAVGVMFLQKGDEINADKFFEKALALDLKLADHDLITAFEILPRHLRAVYKGSIAGIEVRYRKVAVFCEFYLGVLTGHRYAFQHDVAL
jgi:hypothetical protein